MWIDDKNNMWQPCACLTVSSPNVSRNRSSGFIFNGLAMSGKMGKKCIMCQDMFWHKMWVNIYTRAPNNWWKSPTVAGIEMQCTNLHVLFSFLNAPGGCGKKLTQKMNFHKEILVNILALIPVRVPHPSLIAWCQPRPHGAKMCFHCEVQRLSLLLRDITR